MLSITQAIRAIAQDEEEAELHECIGRFLGADAAQEIVQAYDQMIGPASDTSRHGEHLNNVLGTGIVAATMDTVCEDWCDRLSVGVRTTELQHPAAVQCLQLVIRADMLLCDLGLEGTQIAHAVAKAVDSKCMELVSGEYPTT